MNNIKFRQPITKGDAAGTFSRFHYWGYLGGNRFVAPYPNGQPSYQFIGLEDKNKKKIYLGDIVRFRVAVRTTQTHEGDNIPNGSYTEPMEPGIVEYVGAVIFVNGCYMIDTERGHAEDAIPIVWDIRQWTENDVREAIEYYKHGAPMGIFDDPEEGDLQYLLSQYKLADLPALLEYLSGIEVIGNVF